MKKILFVILLMGISLLMAQSFGQNKVNAVVQDWSVLKTMHFDIYFLKGEDEFGKTAALMAEEIYYYLKADLKYPVLSRIPLIFYSTKSEFQVTNIIYPLLSEGVGGFTESLRNRVVVPFDGSYSNLEELLAHELTHAYINALDERVTNAIESLRPSAFPFWFSEGLPEFLSIGGEDEYNNMFILDMVVNDNLPGLDYIDGYLAYRLGESFLTYIANTYGRDKVSEYFYSLRTMTNLEEATKRVFGIKFSELESRWKYQLKRDYYPTVNSHKIPQEEYERRTNNKEDGSYFNFSPRFSPDGSRYAYFSDAGARYSIWLAGTHGIAKPRKILTGETTGKLEEFYFMRSNLSWFPDGKRLAFAAKTTEGDRIHILNVDKGKIEDTITIPNLRAIFELDVASDGQRIVMSAQQNMQTDIYIYNIENQDLQQLTNDSFYDAQPRFSPDGTRIVFSSERNEDPQSHRYGYFANYSMDIFEYRLPSSSLWQITNETYNCTQPMYLDSGNKIAFVSARNEITNLELIDSESNQIATISNVLAGIYNGDFSQDGNYMVVSNYFNGAWNIYFETNPIPNPQYQEFYAATPYNKEYDLLDRIDFTELDKYGKSDKSKPVRSRNPNASRESRRPFISGFEPVVPDTAQIAVNFSWDDRPQEASDNPPVIQKYRPRFALDTLWGGLAYSSSYGAIGSVEVGLSDLMGDHGIGISVGIADQIKKSNLVFSYLYLKRRTDLGFGVYNLYNEAYYLYYYQGESDYYRLRQRQSGFYALARYPFNRFARVEVENMLFDYEMHWDYLLDGNIETDNWDEDIDHVKTVAYAPRINLVYDNALYGSTGPLLGFKGILSTSKSFAKQDLDYFTNYIDLRSYTLFSKRYSLALRANAGISTGSDPDYFSLGGYYGVRALDYNLAGKKKVLTTVELRFPLLDYIAMAFPLPLSLGNIRGSAYVDAGAVWNDNSKFRGAIDGKLEDIKLGYGFGPRLNIGYFVLKLDVAWLTDFSKISKPQVYLSLSEDF
ncbi:MAG: BamA/TamA family outer membrane protein [Candidatus Cloacimonetes bacterium]|jgi:Tol biopolymer transport system component|nr:BamA/TamA family outer membrane protein [Candidatus Cloacimonadota bacterium]MCK9332333.1 BamA/TamA family outer membrane protein [Candidatus Cloacimonadota bacterium]MDY0299687.1 BamA/TamA family outer membrane protein [Candidatus Cloacimonadaceae bacterium]